MRDNEAQQERAAAAPVPERPTTPRRRLKKALRAALMWLGLHTLPYLYVAYMWFVYATSRVEYLGYVPARSHADFGRGIIALWHDEVFFVAWTFRNDRIHTLASEGDSGELITRMLELCNFVVFRGGSTTGKRRRGALEALRLMIRHMRKESGVVYGITTDGSKGPIYRAKPGAAAISIATGAPVTVLKTWCKRYIQLSTWDRTIVPLPFNHIAHVCAGPMLPPEGARGAAATEAFNREIEASLCRVSAWARRHVEGRPPPREWIDLFPEEHREAMARAERPVLTPEEASGKTRAGS